MTTDEQNQPNVEETETQHLIDVVGETLMELNSPVLGELFKAYLLGLQDTDYEGYTPAEQEALAKVLEDMNRAYMAGVLDK